MEGSAVTKSVPSLSNFYAVSLGVYPGEDPNEQRENAFQAFEDKFGDRPEVTLGLTGYTDVQLIVEAIKKADGSTDGKEVAEAMQTITDFPAMTGSITYTEQCHIPFDGNFVVIQMTDGKPSLAAEVKPSYVPKAPC
jgi:branched-chain amino acid transport system substrate-binding protein